MKSAFLTVSALVAVWFTYGSVIAVTLHTFMMSVINHLSVVLH